MPTKGEIWLILIALLSAGCSSTLDTDAFFTGTGGGGLGQFGASALTFTPASLNFSTQRTFTTSSAQTTVLKNNSGIGVNLLSLGAVSSTHYSISSTTCPIGSTLGPGASCTVALVFHPTVSGQIDYGFSATYSGGLASTQYQSYVGLTGVGATDVVFPGLDSVDTVRARSVNLHWTDVANENGYAYFYVSGGTLIYGGAVPRDSTSVTFSGLSPNTAYTFRVRAIDFFGSMESNTNDVAATTLPDPAPTDITDRTFAAGNPLLVNTTLNVDINNTATASDSLMYYTCTYDTVLDASVSSGSDCSTLPGVVMDAGFSGTAGSVDGNGILSFTPTASQASQSYEFRITASDSSIAVDEFFKVNVKAGFKYDATLIAAYKASNADGNTGGINSPFTSTWTNLAPTGSSMDATLVNGLFTTGWLGNGTWASNPFRLSFAGTSGASADRAIAATTLNAEPLLMFTSWLRPSNTALGTQAYVFGTADGGTSGWSLLQRADGNYEFKVGSTSLGGTSINSLSPAAYFKLDELVGAQAFDEATSTNFAVVNNASVTMGGAGALPGSTSFRFTTTGYIQISPAIDITNAWAVAAWIKMPLPSDGNWKTLVRGSVSEHALLFDSATNILGLYNSGFVSSGFDADTLSAGWHHFASVGTGTGSTRFFVDGAFISQAAQTTATDFGAVGNYQSGGQPIYDVDEVALFTHTLTDSEIYQIYIGGCITSLTQNAWTHVGGVFNGTLAQLYRNGTKQCEYTPTGTITGSTQPFSIGAQNSGSEAWPGELGDVLVYNSGAAADVLANYTAQSSEYGLASCAAWKAAGFNTDGVYAIDIDGLGPLTSFDAHCDMTTDGGGWTLALNYVHLGGTNPAVTARTTSLPLIGSSTLGADEAANATYWGHASPALLNNATMTEMRYFCQSSAHGRTFHVKSNSASCINYYKTGTGNCGDISTTYTALSGHTGITPATAYDASFTSQGTSAMTEFTFYRSGMYHWGIRGLGGRWECDDYAGGSASNTIHRIWYR